MNIDFDFENRINVCQFFVSNTYVNVNGYYIILKPRDWDDYGFKTMFNASFYYNGKIVEDLGAVKIAYLDDFRQSLEYDEQRTTSYLIPNFYSLGDSFCSLWQDVDSYTKVRRIEKEYNLKIFEALQDVVTRIEELDALYANELVHTSLFRFVSKFTCINQYYRIYNDEPALTNYHIEIPYTDYKDDYMVFDVKVKSLPPTNVHAIIGSNGCGKTFTIKKIVHSFIDSNCIYDEMLGVERINNNYTDEPFESIFLITFNPFDSYEEISWFQAQHSKIFKYIGSRNQKKSEENKDINELKKQFKDSLTACLTIKKKVVEWNSFIEDMKNNFPVFSFDNFIIERVNGDEYYRKQFMTKADELFDGLSAGYKEVVSIVAGCIAHMVEKSLVLMDEPENHLHPPLLSMLIRWLSKTLVERNAVAIIATHSPIILQEIPKSCVWIMQKNGENKSIRRPEFETFGSNLSKLTYGVFKYEIDNSGFNQLLKKVADESSSYDEALYKFDNQLGDEARSVLRILCHNKE